MVRGAALLEAHHPLPCGPASGPAELEASGRRPNRIEIPLHRLSREPHCRDGTDDRQNHGRALHRLEILATLRSRDRGIPVLILTARDAVEDRVVGLDTGADDYLVKPFAFPELSARIRALLRRGRAEQSSRLQVADLEVDVAARRVTRGGRILELTAREFERLEYLLRNRARVVSRERSCIAVHRSAARRSRPGGRPRLGTIGRSRR